MKTPRNHLLAAAASFALGLLTAHAADTDSDGLDDAAETGTGVYLSPTNTGTNPAVADTDGDGVPDGLEVKEKTSPVDGSKFNSFSRGLAGYWPFRGNASDESGNGNHGVIEGATKAPDRLGNQNHAFVFDGINDRIVISPKTAWPSGSAARTVACWVKSQPHVGNIFTFGDGRIRNSRFSLLLGRGGNQNIGFIGEDNNSIFSNYNLPNMQWNHVVLNYNGSEFEYFVNGIICQRFTVTKLLATDGSKPLVIGSNSLSRSDEFFNGAIDDVRVYDRKLTENESRALYNSEMAQFQIIQGF